MPVWALIGFAAVVTAVTEVAATMFMLVTAHRHSWTLGYTAVAVGLANLLVIVVVLTLTTSVLRSIDRRTR